MFSTEEAPPPPDSFEGSQPTFQVSQMSPQTVLCFDNDMEKTGQLKRNDTASTSSSPHLHYSAGTKVTTEEHTLEEELASFELSSIEEPDSESSSEFEPHRFKCESLFSSYPPVDIVGRSAHQNSSSGAQLVHMKQESQVVNKRIELALQKEREHATITQEGTDDREVLPPERAAAKKCSRKRRAGVCVVMLVAVAVLTSVVIILTKEDPVHNDAPPTLAPTIAPTLSQMEPTFVHLPGPSIPSTTSHDGLSDSSKKTITVIFVIAAGSAALVGCIVYSISVISTQDEARREGNDNGSPGDVSSDI